MTLGLRNAFKLCYSFFLFCFIDHLMKLGKFSRKEKSCSVFKTQGMQMLYLELLCYTCIICFLKFRTGYQGKAKIVRRRDSDSSLTDM
ncbi:hypothetical protein GDO78_016890 [Eleutherodactylus coqui]|uniref:Uncharacterized protein n=1 Tax=Eleutherodactylus coqui TaxID=57060 RepID=A0A8J6EAC1_ELECQ|nr:hypothetical protein GDO78_016890 [Eleutherodactylus coqui]